LAQIGFEFPDIQATHLLKEESLRDLGKIYYMDDQNILMIEKTNQTEFVINPHWRQNLSYTTFEQLLRMNDLFRDTLLNIKFTDPRTLSKLHQFGLASKEIIAYSPSCLATKLPDEVWDQIEKITFSIPTPASRYVLKQYQKNNLLLQEDLAIENSLRQLIKNSVPLKMTKVEPGSRLINAGEQITPRHLAMLKGMKRALSEQRHFASPLTMLGSFMLSLALISIGSAYCKAVYPQVIKSVSQVGLIVFVLLITLLISKVTEYFFIHKSDLELCRYPIFVLFTALTLSILINRGVAILVSGFASLVLTIALSIEHQYFMIINFSTAFLGIIFFKKITKRNDIFKICIKIWLVTIPLIVSLTLLEYSFWNHRIFIDCLVTLVSIAVTGGLVIALLPFLESLFGVTTDMTLMESANPNHPLLRRLSLEAIGTYQHSLAVAALAEEAALAINANALLCRIASLYHDVGKLAQPEYFTENQFSELNLHQCLTPFESAQIIISHVAEGIKLAQHYDLPSNVIDLIREHHGTGLVYYFYKVQMAHSCRTASLNEEKQFRYPGPRPRNRESAIVMIADCIEAASRSMEEINEKSVTELVKNIVIDKIQEHQLDSSHLTFNEIEMIKKTFVRGILGNAYKRVKYPAITPLKEPSSLISEPSQ